MMVIMHSENLFKNDIISVMSRMSNSRISKLLGYVKLPIRN